MKLETHSGFDFLGWSAGIRNLFEPRRATTIRQLTDVTRLLRLAMEAEAGATADTYAEAA